VLHVSVIFGGVREVVIAVTKRFRKRFTEPMPLPRGRQLVTLEDAGNYITIR
jgi:hypothetical protein